MRCTLCHKAKGDSQFAEWIDIFKKLGERIRIIVVVDTASNLIRNRGKQQQDAKEKLECKVSRMNDVIVCL